MITYLLSLEAECALRAGQPAVAARHLEEAFRALQSHDQRFWEAELHRLRGDLALASHEGGAGSRRHDAERSFRQALDIARRQGAKSLELRAAISLGRLWRHEREKREEGRKLLAEVYGGFTEGFDTLDLREARELLEAFA